MAEEMICSEENLYIPVAYRYVNNDSQNSHNTQQTRAKQNALCFTQKDTQPSQACSGGHITPNPTQNRCG